MSGDAAQRLGARFAKLWAASTTSALGSGMATIATPLFVASRTHDPLIVSAAFSVAWLPWLLFALPGGVLVDRVDRRRLMIVLDCVRAVAMAVLGTTIITGHASVALLYAVLFVVNAGEVVFRSASQAFLPDVVPRDKLERANGWLSGGFMLTQQMAAGPLGGFLFVVAAGLPFLANAGTYAASAILIGLIAGGYGAPTRGESQDRTGTGEAQAPPGPGEAPARPATGEAQARASSVRADVVEGFRWLMRQRLLRTMAILIGLMNVTLVGAMAVLVLLAKERLHLGSVGYGLLFTCMAAGGILGSVIGDRLIRWVTATWTIRIGLLIEASTHLSLAISSNVYFIGSVLFAFGLHDALWTIASNSLRQRLTPPHLLGRVGSTTLFIAAGGNCLGALIGGTFAATFGITAPFWAGFVVAIIVSVTTWRVFNRRAVAEAYAPTPTPEPPMPEPPTPERVPA